MSPLIGRTVGDVTAHHLFPNPFTREIFRFVSLKCSSFLSPWVSLRFVWRLLCKRFFFLSFFYSSLRVWSSGADRPHYGAAWSERRGSSYPQWVSSGLAPSRTGRSIRPIVWTPASPGNGTERIHGVCDVPVVRQCHPQWSLTSPCRLQSPSL